MNLLIDIGHPADFHTFKNLAGLLKDKGHEVLFTCREKEFVKTFLDKAGFAYRSFGKPYNTLPGKGLGLLEFGFKEYMAARRFKMDLILSHTSVYAAHAAFLLKKPHISIADTFTRAQMYLYKPFTEVILTGDYAHPIESHKVIPYSGYHELAYLHPKRFSPDENVLNELGISKGEQFVIMRFVAWKAFHDMGHKGISTKNRIRAAETFEKHARVFISSEKPLPAALQQYAFPLSPDRMHHAMAFASMVYGESSTMAAEAAVLGVPGVFLNNQGTYYTRELENKYGLVFNYTESKKDQEASIRQGVEILTSPGIRETWQNRRQLMLKDKIDVTDFLLWFVEHYPDSKNHLQEKMNKLQ